MPTNEMDNFWEKKKLSENCWWIREQSGLDTVVEYDVFIFISFTWSAVAAWLDQLNTIVTGVRIAIKYFEFLNQYECWPQRYESTLDVSSSHHIRLTRSHFRDLCGSMDDAWKWHLYHTENQLRCGTCVRTHRTILLLFARLDLFDGKINEKPHERHCCIATAIAVAAAWNWIFVGRCRRRRCWFARAFVSCSRSDAWLRVVQRMPWQPWANYSAETSKSKWV